MTTTTKAPATPAKAAPAIDPKSAAVPKIDKISSAFNCPPKPRTGAFKDGCKALRGGKRGRIIELASRPSGVSAEELMAEFTVPKGGKWTKKNVVEALRKLHNEYGYGFKTDEKGRIRSSPVA